MAKIKGILSQTTGKVEGLGVIYESGGQTILRKNSKAVDRKSNDQKIQRVIMNTVFAQYRAFKPLANHSFEGISIGRKSQQEFTKKNAQALRMRATQVQNAGQSLYDLYNFNPVGIDTFSPAAIILSMGQLHEIQPGLTPGASAKGVLATGKSAPTYADIANVCGARRGDQLTFVTVEKHAAGSYKVHYCRVILDPHDAQGNQLTMADTAFIADGAINMPSRRNQGSFASLSMVGTDLQFNIAGYPVAAVGIIASRRYNEDWLRSNCKLILSEDVLGSDKNSLMGCVESYGQASAIDVESEFYLNNAGTGNNVADAGNGGGSSTPSHDPDAVTVNSGVAFTANGSTLTQNVNGGSTSVNGPVSKMTFSGHNLDQAAIKAGTTNDVSAATAAVAAAGGESAEWTPAEAVANGSTIYCFKGGALWFTASVVAPAGPGDGNGSDE